jgi:hypothetical protein
MCVHACVCDSKVFITHVYMSTTTVKILNSFINILNEEFTSEFENGWAAILIGTL